MNYEEKYEQALKRARDYYLTGKGEPVDFIKMIFPELQESEDERIRKGIIRNLQYLMDRSEGFVKEDLQERITWLEKQGKALNPDKVIEWLNDQACLGWIEDVEVDKFIEQFKKDFNL